jgi:hypothetical protein
MIESESILTCDSMSTTKLVLPLIRYGCAVTQGNEQASWQQTEVPGLALILNPGDNENPNVEASIQILQGTTVLVTKGAR